MGKVSQTQKELKVPTVVITAVITVSRAETHRQQLQLALARPDGQTERMTDTRLSVITNKEERLDGKDE